MLRGMKETIRERRRKTRDDQAVERYNHSNLDMLERWDVYDSRLEGTANSFQEFFAPVLPVGFTRIPEVIADRFAGKAVIWMELGGPGFRLAEDLAKEIPVKKSYAASLNTFGSREDKTKKRKGHHVFAVDVLSLSHSEIQPHSSEKMHIPGWEIIRNYFEQEGVQKPQVFFVRFAGPVYEMMSEKERTLFFYNFLRWYKIAAKHSLFFIQFPPSFLVEKLADRLNATGAFKAIGKNVKPLESALFLEKLPGAPDSLDKHFREHPFSFT